MKKFQFLSGLFLLLFCFNCISASHRNNYSTIKTEFDGQINFDNNLLLQPQKNNVLRLTPADKKFTIQQMEFMVGFFRKSFAANHPGEKINVQRGADGITVFSGSKNDGTAPSVSVSSSYGEKFIGDFDGDGNNEIIFTATVFGGGSAHWDELYCFKLVNGRGSKIIPLEVSCPCQAPYSCQSSPKITLLDVLEKNILLEHSCITPEDGECCPSLFYEVSYKFQADKLIELGKKEIKK